ncbi:hypothetical protein AP94_0792 [Staphylococcus aureus Lyso 1 2010]|nr:conserved hypothetical protein [Staphylococcus aureus subsp. aureus str. JKD6008]AEB87755.1 hypothetical protein SAT0131_00686 [Staphylococcus aureus subsp. aureus T0131]AWR06870.1 hypothetical protein CSB81_2101 [Staphylococcus aureus]EFM05665.1 hypothetical protein HMPREF0783_2706 [Staphylococcus aureus subsp. aureus ATCC BAA-39]EFW33690.1 hypothetical protein HMPREF9529_02617 [Staphylococcus aureus subsp. aureus MRSA177]EGG66296.1 hypothetical protein SA21189_2450 [Staphylococcus aureus 
MNKVSLSKVNNKIIYLHYHYRENIQLIYNNVEKNRTLLQQNHPRQS